MEIKKNHFKIGDYIVQYSDGNKYGEDKGFVVLDTTQENRQIGYAHEHLCDALEDALLFG